MAVVAPLAFLVVLTLVFLLFGRLVFLLPVGLDAMLAVIWTMGLLIGTGQTVHIMSSMIPVFLMPIAILDDVHVLSAFLFRYRVSGDKQRALLEGIVVAPSGRNVSAGDGQLSGSEIVTRSQLAFHYQGTVEVGRQRVAGVRRGVGARQGRPAP